MAEYQAMLDAVRVGLVNPVKADCPSDIQERANHLKGFCYFNDASMVGICQLADKDLLAQPFRNPEIDRLAHRLKTEQTKTLAAGIDMIMADLKASMDVTDTSLDGHSHAIVIAYAHHEHPRRKSLARTGF